MSDSGKPPRMGYEHLAAEQQARLGDLLWEANAAASRLLEFTAGLNLAAFTASELHLAATAMLLPLIAAPARELHQNYPNEAQHLSGLEALEAALAAATPEAHWHFVHDTLPELAGTLAARLEAWHAG